MDLSTATYSNIAFDAVGRPADYFELTNPLPDYIRGTGFVMGRYRNTAINTLPPNFHFVLQAPAASIPTIGTVIYKVAAATMPTTPTSDATTVVPYSVAMNLGVSFGSTVAFGLDGTISLASDTMSFASPGGSAAPSLHGMVRRAGFEPDEITLAGTRIAVTSATAGLCSAALGCSLFVSATGGGVGVSTFGLLYFLTPNDGANTVTLSGAALLTPTGTTTLTPPVVPSTSATYAGGGFGDAGPITVGIDGSGVVRKFGYTTIETARLIDGRSTPGWIIGRYADGTTSQVFNGVTQTQTYGPNDGIAFAYATALATAIPTTGTATYGIAAFTTPTVFDASVVTNATLTGGFAIAFGSTPRLGAAGILTLTNGGTQRYEFTSPGGLTAPSLAIFPFDGTLTSYANTQVTTTDSRCATNCSILFNLATGGAASDVVAGTYAVGTLAAGGSAFAGLLRGAVVATTATPVGAIPTSVPIPTPTPTPTPAPTGAPTSNVAFAGFGNAPSLNALSNFSAASATSDGKIASIRRQGRGTNTDHEYGGTGGVIGFSRWSGGTTTEIVAGDGTTTIPENAGAHLVWGTPLSARPTSGTINYQLRGATAPTINSGSIAPGTFRSASLAVDFATARVGFALTIGFGGIDYTMASDGGVARLTVPLTSDGLFTSRVAGPNVPLVTGGSCTGGNCGGAVIGFLAGAGATHAGLAYNFLAPAGIVNGVAAFAQAGLPPDPAPVPGGIGVSSSPMVGIAFAGLGTVTTYGANATATVDASGRPTSFNIYGAPATATLAQFLTGPGWALGRYANGAFSSRFTTGVPSGSGPNSLTNYAADGGLQFALATRLAQAPTGGTAVYTVAASTDLSNAQGQNATLTASSLAMNLGVAFGSAPRIGFDGRIGVTVNGTASSVNFSTAGGSAAPSVTTNISQLLLGDTFSATGSAALTGSSGALCGTLSGCRVDASFTGGGGSDLTTFAAAYALVSTTTSAAQMNGAAILTRATGTPTYLTTIGTGAGGVSVYRSSRDDFDRADISVDAAGLLSVAAVDTAGQITSRIDRAAATGSDSGGVAGVVGWSRWSGGTSATTTIYGVTNPGATSGSDGTTHIWGSRATSLPTSGTATYTMIGGTAVAHSGSQPLGTIDTATLGVAFGGAPKVGLDLAVLVGGTRYTLASAGGAATPSVALDTASMTFGSTASVVGGSCAGTACTGEFNGFLAGVGASHAGVSFTMPLGSERGAAAANGAVALAR